MKSIVKKEIAETTAANLPMTKMERKLLVTMLVRISNICDIIEESHPELSRIDIRNEVVDAARDLVFKSMY